MTEEGRLEATSEELVLGDAALRAAQALAALDLNHDAMSRLYFAAFHWARALLASAGIEAKTHQGVQSMIGLHFIRTGKLLPAHQHTLSRLETWRTKADYTRGFVADRTLFDDEIVHARTLRAAIEALIEVAPSNE